MKSAEAHIHCVLAQLLLVELVKLWGYCHFSCKVCFRDTKLPIAVNLRVNVYATEILSFIVLERTTRLRMPQKL